MSGSVALALLLLAVNGVIGAVDTIWFHEIRGQLPARGGGVRAELALHAGRDAIYCVVYGSLPWVAWSGSFALVLAALLVLELVITFCDFAVEAAVRPVPAVERILHTSMGIVYGAMLASLVPVLVRWSDGPTGLVAAAADDVPVVLRWTLSAFALGIAASGVRDAVAAIAGPGRRASFPWVPQTAAAPIDVTTTVAVVRPWTLELGARRIELRHEPGSRRTSIRWGSSAAG